YTAPRPAETSANRLGPPSKWSPNATIRSTIACESGASWGSDGSCMLNGDCGPYGRQHAGGTCWLEELPNALGPDAIALAPVAEAGSSTTSTSATSTQIDAAAASSARRLRCRVP